jgi:hypothetical protein
MRNGAVDLFMMFEPLSGRIVRSEESRLIFAKKTFDMFYDLSSVLNFDYMRF